MHALLAGDNPNQFAMTQALEVFKAIGPMISLAFTYPLDYYSNQFRRLQIHNAYTHMHIISSHEFAWLECVV